MRLLLSTILILLLFHAWGCASNSTSQERQHSDMKTRGTDETFKQEVILPEAGELEDKAVELSIKASQEMTTFPIGTDRLEEREPPFAKTAERGLEETTQSPSRIDSDLTTNSESMFPFSEPQPSSAYPDLKENEPDSLENGTTRESRQLNRSQNRPYQPTPEPESIETLLEKGRAYVSRKEYTLAFAQFDRLVGLSNDVTSYYYRGYASIKLHRYKEAVSDFSQAIQLGRDIDARQHGGNSSLAHQSLSESYRERAFAYFQLQQFRLALADITTFLDMNTGEDVVLTDEYVLRGRVYSALEQTELAIADFSEALRLSLASRSQAYIYYLRGLSFFQIKKVQLGLQDMDLSCGLRFEKACGFFEQIQ